MIMFIPASASVACTLTIDVLTGVVSGIGCVTMYVMGPNTGALSLISST